MSIFKTLAKVVLELNSWIKNVSWNSKSPPIGRLFYFLLEVYLLFLNKSGDGGSRTRVQNEWKQISTCVVLYYLGLSWNNTKPKLKPKPCHSRTNFQRLTWYIYHYQCTAACIVVTYFRQAGKYVRLT